MAAIVLDIRGIEGNCTIAGYEGFIDAVSVFDSQEMPVPQGSNTTGRTAGRAVQGDIQVVRYVDGVSPLIARVCSTNKVISKIRILLLRTIEGRMVDYACFKLYNCNIVRLARQSEDAEGGVFGHQVTDTADVVTPSANAGVDAVLAQRSTSDRPAVRTAKPSLSFSPTEGFVERLWIQPTAVYWTYNEYLNGVRKGSYHKGWHFEEGVDIGESSLAA